MQSTDVPDKFTIPFAANAVAGDIRAIPVTTTDPTAASLDAGFPPATFTPVGAGGSPPDGRDFNGLGKQSTAWDRWFSAGGPITYDATFQAAVGGYPKGTIVQSATTFGTFYYCLVESNVTDPDASGAGWQAFQISVVIPGAGAQLQFLNPTALLLAPYGGGFLWVNGLNYRVPAGLVLPTSVTTANTLYFVYAYITAGAMALEASTTGYVLGANGIALKAGDATRSLVGAAFMDGSNQFNDNATKRNVASWYARTSRALNGPGTNVDKTNTTMQELATTSRVEAVTWSDQGTIAILVGTTQLGSNLDIAQVVVGIDGVPQGYGTSSQEQSTSYRQMGAVGAITATLGVGRHIWSPFGLSQGGNLTNFQVGIQALIGA